MPRRRSCMLLAPAARDQRVFHFARDRPTAEQVIAVARAVLPQVVDR